MDNSYVLMVVDVETTNLNVVDGDVIEISMIRLMKDHNDEYTEEQRTWSLKPINPSAIDPEALKINGSKLEDLLHNTQYGRDTYRDPNEVIVEIEQWIAEDGVSSVDRIFAGQNPFFDVSALTELWRKTGNSQTFPFSLERNNRILDTKQLAILVDICNNRRRLRYDLSGLVKAFGVKKGKAHRAAEDTKMTSDLLLKILQPMRKVIRAEFSEAYLKDEST